jgi:P27 family predicted phage terminase small subunit
MRGRKKIPTRLKVLHGNPGRRDLPANEPKPDSDLPEPPEHLDEYARQEWVRLAPGLHTLGLLYDVDRAVFAAYCETYSKWRHAEDELNKLKKEGALKAMVLKTISGNYIQNPLVGIARGAMADMVKYAIEFGLTPAARARLGTEAAPKKKSKFEGLINGGKK